MEKFEAKAFKAKVLSNSELELIKSLRAESDNAKETFAKYSFQSWAFTIAFLAVLIRLQQDQLYIGLAGIFPLALLIAVLRIGIYSFTTANRIYGFELYLNRRRRLASAKEDEITLGWEEANYVWRIVQSSLYRAVFYKEVPPPIAAKSTKNSLLAFVNQRASGFAAATIRSLRKIEVVRETQLFRTKDPTSERASFYAGSFLRTHFFIVSMLCFTCHVPLLYALVGYANKENYLTSIFFAIVLTFAGAFSILRMRRLQSRRKILEGGMLSINCCAFIWQIVAKVHFRAIFAISETDGELISYRGYSDELQSEANKLVLAFLGRGDDGIYDHLGTVEEYAPSGTF